MRDAFEEPAGDLWFFDAGQAAVGALFDMGVYATSQVVATCGDVARVFGRTATLSKPTTLEDTATLLLEFESGALGTVETSWCDPARTGFLHVHGTRGKLTSPGHEANPLTHWTPGSYTREDIPPVPEAVDVGPFDVGNAHRALRGLRARGDSAAALEPPHRPARHRGVARRPGVGAQRAAGGDPLPPGLTWAPARTGGAPAARGTPSRRDGAAGGGPRTGRRPRWGPLRPR